MEGLALAPPIGALGHRGVDRGAGVAQPVVAVGDRLEREEPQAPCRGGAFPLLWLGIAGPATASTPGRAGIRGMSNGMCPTWLSPETRIQRRAHPAVLAGRRAKGRPLARGGGGSTGSTRGHRRRTKRGRGDGGAIGQRPAGRGARPGSRLLLDAEESVLGGGRTLGENPKKMIT